MAIGRPAVRLVLAISLDGRLAPPEGGAAQLGGSGDRRVLEESLAWADATLIGAGTLRAHRCTCLIHEPDLLRSRLDQGRSAQPASVVVSRSGDFPLQWPFFEQPLQRWLMAPESPSNGFQYWIPLGTSWMERLAALERAGIHRLVLLGGAQLAGELLQADCVDALQLTLVPKLLGGPHTWVPQVHRGLPSLQGGAGAWLLEETTSLGGGELLLRYRRQRESDQAGYLSPN